MLSRQAHSGQVDVASRPHLRALTGLRFGAALAVVFFHCTRWQSWPVPEFVRSLVGSGYVAVSLFFILSGFILTYAHCGEGARPLVRSRFYLSRFARVYPAYAFALVVVAPFFLVHTLRVEGAGVLGREVIAVVTLTQAWVPQLSMAWNPPGWSLSAEAFFYFLFPLVAPTLVASRRRTAVGAAIACYAFCWLVPLAYLRLAPDGDGPVTHVSTAFWLSVLRYNPAVRFPEFVLGILLAKMYFEVRGSPRYQATASILSMVSLVGVAAVLSQAQAIPYPLLHDGLLAPVLALLIVSLPAGRGPIATLLATRPLVALGDASYSLYLLHVPLLIVWTKVVVLALGERFLAGPANTALFVLFVVGASLLCFRYVERPMRELVLARWGSRAR